MQLSLLVLAVLAGLASASSNSGWKAGYEYVYKVKARTIVGLEGQQQQYAGVELRTPSLRVQVRDPNTLVVKPEGIRLSKIHDQLDQGWLADDAEFQQMQDADTAALEEPFLMHMEKGIVKSILVSGSITPEAANIQKAFASALQMDLQETNAIQRASTQANSLTGLGSKRERVIYRTMEDAINGECETLYDISAIPKYMVKEDPDQIPVPEACPGDRFFQVVATTNFSNCNHRPAINFAAPAQIKGTPGTQRIGDYWTRAEETIYTICGNSRSDYVIQSIASKEVVAVDPFGYAQEEKLTAGSSMNLTLKDVRPISSPVSSPSNPVKLTELAFEYPEVEVDSQGENRMGSPNPYSSGRYTRSTKSKQHGSERRSQEEDDDSWSGRDEQHHDSRRHGQQQRHGDEQSRRHQSQQDDSDFESYESQKHSSRRHDDQKSFHPRSLSMRTSHRGASQSGSSSGSMEQPDLKTPLMYPLLQFGVSGASNKFPGSSQIKSIVVRLTKEIVDDLDNPSEMPQKETAGKVHQLSRGIALLKKEQIKDAEQQIQQQLQSGSDSGSHSESRSDRSESRSDSRSESRSDSESHSDSHSAHKSDSYSAHQSGSSKQMKQQAARQIFLDAATMSGTNPALMFIIEQVESQKIKGEQAAQLLMTIPKYAKTPTKELIEEFGALVKKLKSTGQRLDQVETTALLAWSALIQKACMNPQARRSKYSKAQFGSFCSPHTKAISEQWVPSVVQRLRDAKTPYEEAVAITALGNIGHESIISPLKEYISGANDDTSNHARTKAIFALKNIVLPNSHYSQNEPKIKRAVQDALTTIFSSPAEQYEARMAAFSLLVYSDAPFSVWQKAALRTWFEQDNQVNAFIYSTLKNMANLDDPNHYDLSKKAAQALKLAKPVQQGMSYSGNYFSSNKVDDWNLSYFNQLSWFGGRSAAPGNIYFRNNVQRGGMSHTPFEVSLNATALTQVIQEALLQGGLYKDEDEQKYPELAKLTRQLNIESREDGPAEGSLYFRFREMQRMFPIDESLAPHLQKIVKNLAQGPSNLDGSTLINYQKAFMVEDVSMSVPTITGIPIVWNLKAPAILSVQGRAQVQGKGNFVKATATLKPVILKRQEASLSFVEPLTLQRFSAGVRKHFQAYLPMKVSASLDASKQLVQVSVKPGGDDEKKDIQLLHFHVRPFTSIKKMGDFKPITQSGEVKSIHYNKEQQQQKEQQVEFTAGQKSLGLKLRVKVTDESAQKGFASWYERLSKHTPMSALYFWSASPSNAPREYQVIFDQGESETEELKAQIQISTAFKKSTNSGINTTPRKDQQDSQSNDDSTHKARMVRSLDSVSSGHAVTVDAEFELASGKSSSGSKRTYAASVTVAKGNNGLDEKLNIHVQRPEWELCADAQSKFPALPTYSYKDTINKEVRAQAKAQVSYGTRCGSPQIQVQVDMQRSAGQTKYAQNSEEAQRCLEDEKDGQQLSPSCKNATLQAATLNEYDIKIQYQQVSDKLQNATLHLEDLATAYLYPYMSQDRLHVKNQDNEIQIQAKVRATSQDQDDFLDVWIQKPTANIHFRGIPWSDEVETIFPLNARQSVAKRVSDYVLDGNDESKCTLEGENFVTFDNTSYEAELSQQNYHLLTKDSTGSYKFAVLAKAEGKDQKKVRILIKDTEVILSNKGSGSNGAPKAQVNQKEVQVPTEGPIEIEDKNGDVILRLVATKDGYIIVSAPQEGIKVKTDGDRVVIYASQLHSSNLVGLCGDFNGEQLADLQTPEQCVESPQEPEDFVASYEVTASGERSKKHHQQQGRSDVSDEESRRGQSSKHHSGRKQHSAVRGCVREKEVSVAQSGDALEGKSSSSSHSSRPHSRSDSRADSRADSHSGRRHQMSGRQSEEDSDEQGQQGPGETQLRHKVVAKQGMKCFSTKQVPQCKSGRAPQNTFAKEVDFICMDQGSKAQRLEQENNQGQNISEELMELRSKSADDKHSQKLYLPTSCQ